VTVIVGYVSAAAGVMASDSFATEEDFTTGHVEKIWTSGGLLFGYAGLVAVRDPLRTAIDSYLANTPLTGLPEAMVASALRSICGPVLDEAYGAFVGGPADDPTEKLGGSLLIIGHDGTRYWLLEINRNNMASSYTDTGFHTIGTGSVAAHVSRGLLSHYSLPQHEARHLRLQAHRTVATCINVLGGVFGVGGFVQLWQSSEAGFEKVVGKELSAVSEGLQQWIAIEQESLERVFAADAAPEAEAGEPLPERLEDESPG
jgi:hypothetical protein